MISITHLDAEMQRSSTDIALSRGCVGKLTFHLPPMFDFNMQQNSLRGLLPGVGYDSMRADSIIQFLH